MPEVNVSSSPGLGWLPQPENNSSKTTDNAIYSFIIYRYYCSLKVIGTRLKNGEFKNTSTAEELMDIYAMYERAVLYDWALFKGKYSLSEYSDRLLPHVLDTFVDGI